MGAKRKDSKRRNLRTGESQRKDGRYSYRYKMPGESHYHYIYARTLEELRKSKEKIEAEGYSCEIPVIITNTTDYLDVVELDHGQHNHGDKMLKVVR